MKGAPDRRQSLQPRKQRVVFPGPRVRILEFTLLGHIVIAALACLLAYLRFHDGMVLLPVILTLSSILLLLADTQRLVRLKNLKRVALEGAITTGHVVSARRTRFTTAPRADGAMPRAGLPFLSGLEVSYVFKDDEDQEHYGRFLTSPADSAIYPPERPIEVFFLPSEPSQNVSSLVLRWYFRLAGSELLDETPTPDFIGDVNVEIDWRD